jgi:hypothetical protein
MRDASGIKFERRQDFSMTNKSKTVPGAFSILLAVLVTTGCTQGSVSDTDKPNYSYKSGYSKGKTYAAWNYGPWVQAAGGASGACQQLSMQHFGSAYTYGSPTQDQKDYFRGCVDGINENQGK